MMTLTDDERERLAAIQRRTEAAEAEIVACAAERRVIVKEMRARGLSTRDVGRLLGMSATRVVQLCKGTTSDGE